MSVANYGIKLCNAICPFFPKILDKSEFIITQQLSFVSQFNVHSIVILFCEIKGSDVSENKDYGLLKCG
jgi:hypothetical protein